jgi:hypothetical protein
MSCVAAGAARTAAAALGAGVAMIATWLGGWNREVGGRDHNVAGCGSDVGGWSRGVGGWCRSLSGLCRSMGGWDSDVRRLGGSGSLQGRLEWQLGGQDLCGGDRGGS